jgi:hydrogenase maturation protease
MKTLVIGLGNPILGDDGVGWKVAEAVKNKLPAFLEKEGQGMAVDVECLSLGGISLMENLIDYEHAILIDAFALEEPTGTILVLKLSDLPNYSAFHTTNAHDTSLQNAIEMGRSMGIKLPYDVTVVGIATKHVRDFSEELSPPVAEAVPQAAKFVLDILAQINTVAVK